MPPPIFSIITVTYNAETTIERTIRSVMSQTALEHIEYIIIDGASIDRTIDIIRNSQFSTVIATASGAKQEAINSQLISEPDKGLYDAMNKGLQRATGDYAWFLNAGDTLHSNTIVEQIQSSIINHQSSIPDILYGETDIVDNSGNFIAHRRLKAPKKLNWKSFRMGMLVSHQSFIVRREIAPLYDLQYRYSSDVDWCIRCMKKACTIHNSQLILSNYLNEGLTTANRKTSLKERFAIMVKYYGWWPTVIRHLWFILRYSYSKMLNKQL